MSNELIPQDAIEGGALSNADFSDITSSQNFMQRIQLYGSKSNDAIEGKITAKHYGIPTEDGIIDLGLSIDVALLAWRPKALAVKEDPISESFDAESDTFKEIKKLAGVRDSGAMYGPEFLVYAPVVKKFLTFFMSSATARREAKNMEPLLRHAVTLSSRVINDGKHIWDGPVCVACSTPLEMPDLEVIKNQITTFLNPPDRTPELDTSGEDDRG